MKESEELKSEVESLKKEIKELMKNKSLVTYTNNVNHIEIEKQEINITNNITNHITIFQLSPKRIGDLVSFNFEPEHLLKGQVEYANIIHSILDSEMVLYGVTDRSRNRFFYGNEKEQYIEDPNCMTLHSIFLPSLREIKNLFRDCINSPSFLHKQELHKGFLDILSVLENGTTFQSQLSKILPSIKGKDKVSSQEDDTTKEKKQFCKKIYSGMKTEIEDKDPQRPFPEEEKPVPLFIGGVSLGKLHSYYKKYQDHGIYAIPSILKECIETNPSVEKEFEMYVKQGLVHGKKVVRDEYYDDY
jgi:hypothetical protein